MAGPIYSASVILPKDFKSDLIKDSKKLSEKNRIKLSSLIMDVAIDWSIGFVDAKQIDEINIQEATYLSMHKSIDGLNIKPNYILVDGNCFKQYKGIPHECFVKGDNTYLSIAAVSILAKVARDEYMKEQHIKYPNYSWDSNKGYGVKKHIDSIKVYGITEQHRKSFLKNIIK